MHYDVSSAEALTPIAQVVAAVHGAAGDLADSLLLVGAVARDLHLHFVAGLPITRVTKDVDLAVRVGSWQAYDNLLRRFGPARPRHRVTVDGCPVDVVPFGSVERPPGAVSFAEDSVMSVLGHAEALACADTFRLPGGVLARVPSPPALAVLKLLAWVDRGVATDKDARDLGQLLGVYSHPYWADHLFGTGMPFLESHDYDVPRAAVALLGDEAASMMTPVTLRAARAVDRPRLVAQLLPRWFEPGAGVEDVALAVDLFLGSS